MMAVFKSSENAISIAGIRRAVIHSSTNSFGSVLVYGALIEGLFDSLDRKHVPWWIAEGFNDVFIFQQTNRTWNS